MAVCLLSSCKRKSFQLGPLTFKLFGVRSYIALFSTAAKQHSTGDDCNSDDGDDDQRHSVTHVRMLEMRANKLEEQVQDLTNFDLGMTWDEDELEKGSQLALLVGKQLRYKKALADSDNVRRRTQKFVEDAKRFGIQSFCRDLVEVADLLERTAQSMETQSLAHSLSLVQNTLQQVFSKHGLEKMSAVGAPYDPYQHEIVCHTPTEGLDPGTVAIVKQDGYKLHGRTIRHAQVGIAVKKQES